MTVTMLDESRKTALALAAVAGADEAAALYLPWTSLLAGEARRLRARLGLGPDDAADGDYVVSFPDGEAARACADALLDEGVIGPEAAVDVYERGADRVFALAEMDRYCGVRLLLNACPAYRAAQLP